MIWSNKTEQTRRHGPLYRFFLRAPCVRTCKFYFLVEGHTHELGILRGIRGPALTSRNLPGWPTGDQMIRYNTATRALQPTVSSRTFNALHYSPKQGSLALWHKRSITLNYRKKTSEAKEAWDKHAVEIEAGRQESMLTMLEKRGYVNAIAGYSPFPNQLGPLTDSC